MDLLREVKALAGHGQPEQAQVEEDDTGRHWQGSHQSPAEVLARLSGPTLCQDGAPDCDLPGGLIPEQAQVEEDDTGRHWQGSHQSL